MPVRLSDVGKQSNAIRLSDIDTNRRKKFEAKEEQPKQGFFARKSAETEQKIAGRDTMIQSLVRDPITFKSIKEHPFKSAGRAAAGALEYIESVPAGMADVALGGLPIFKPTGGAEAFKKTLTGERMVERGDIFRKGGVPEVLSAIGGMATGLPEEKLMKGVGSGVKALGKVTGVNRVLGAAAKYGKGAIAKTLNMFSDIPEKDIMFALDNPKLLSKRYVQKGLSKIKNIRKTKIDPVIQNLKNKVDFRKSKVAQNVLDDIKLDIKGDVKVVQEGLTTKVSLPVEKTRTSTSMSLKENKDVRKWMSILKKKDVTLNEVDSAIAEIDKGLGKYYSAIDKAKAKPISKTYETVSLKLRAAFRDGINQYTDVAQHLDEYSTLLKGQRLIGVFDKWSPHIMRAMSLGTAAGAMGARDPNIFLGTTAATIPKVQGMAIQGISGALEGIGKYGAPAAYRAWQFEQGKR